VGLAQRASKDRKVLRKHKDKATINGTIPSDDRVTQRASVLDAKTHGPVRDQHAQLSEAPGIQEQIKALAGSQLAGLMLPFYPVGTASKPGLFL
jgi:hypothetical protein